MQMDSADFFIAVDMDLRTLRDPQVQCRVGETVTAPVADGVLAVWEASVLHASTTPGAAAVGVVWPFRLLKVRGTPVDRLGEVCAFRSLAVECELPAAYAFGPHGRNVVQLLGHARTLDIRSRHAIARDRRPRENACVVALWAARRAAAIAGEIATESQNAWFVGREMLHGSSAAAAVAEALYAIASADLVGSSGYSSVHAGTLLDAWRRAVPAATLLSSSALDAREHH